MNDTQLNVLRLMPCAYDGWAPVAGGRPVRRSIVIDQLVGLGMATLSNGIATRTPAGDAEIAA